MSNDPFLRPDLSTAAASIDLVHEAPAPAGGATAARVDGKFLRLQGRRFWIKGVTYGSFSPNDAGEPFPAFERLRDDFARMRDCGINTVRIYSPPSDRIADAAHEAGLRLIPDICWGPRRCELDDPERVKFIFDWTRQHARRLASHPAILMHSIGNEVPPLVVRWYGRRRIETFIGELYETIKEQSPETLVTYVNHPPTEHLLLPFLDVVSYNVYLEREPEFRAYLARLQSLTGDRPLFLAEIGLDSHRNGHERQADVITWQLRAAFEKGACGAAVYSWTDEWAVFNEAIGGWAFGLTDHERQPRPACRAVETIYGSSIYELRREPWPRVSVIVCSYNGAGTLHETLQSLRRLSYPDYEVILIDDGSKDETPEIVRRHAVRCIRVPNGGLSRARNLGIEAATGDIIAFIDSDAYADPDWLYFLVTALEAQDAHAVGGPNLAPPHDGFTAHCVDHAPGNPTHVLLDNELAEHVPGCNMAFRKEALREVSLFDPTHRTAGDDVDVCWKLLVRGRRIAFSPCAVVWHHRRASIRAFLRQQRGYGYAEGHLQRRYPGRFNVFSDLVWAGRIYDSEHSALRAYGLPALFRPRVYQGRFGSAQFQSLYQPYRSWWFQVFTTAEWQALLFCVLSAAVLGMSMGAAAGRVLAAGAALMGGLTLAAATVPAINAVRHRRWRGWKRWRGTVSVAFLHVAQPLARAFGHVLGWWRTRHQPPVAPAVRRLWGNLTQREAWLERLQHHMSACGWICRPGDGWNAADLEILGPGPYRLELTSVYEENLERGWYFVRYRITARIKRSGVLAGMVLVSTMPLFLLFPYLLPLAAPVAFGLWRLAGAKRYMILSVSQLATECAEALNMPRADDV